MGRSFNFPKFQAGQPLLPQLTADRLNALIDAIDRNRVEFGDNITGQRTPGGTIVRAHSRGSDAGVELDVSFALSDATVTEGDPPEVSNKVQVSDGKINGEFPTGMGSGEYILDLADPEDSIIYAIVTFDADTLSILSRDLGSAGSGSLPDVGIDPDTSVGTFIVMLGFTYFDTDGNFRIWQTQLGDINFELIYGAHNGAPALIAVAKQSSWMELPTALL